MSREDSVDRAADKAREAALRLLTHRPRSVRELRDRLSQRFPEEAANAVVKSLARSSLLDDEAFARWWTESRTGSRPMAATMIASELAQKGVSQDVVAGAVADVDDAANARALARRLSRTLPADDYHRFVRRLSGRLARRGYSAGLVRSVVSEAWVQSTEGVLEAGSDA